MKLLALPALALLLASGHASAQARTAWAHQNGMVRNDGAVVVRSVANPNATVTAAQNPTAANVQPAANIATQPPLLVQKRGFDRWSLYYADRAQGVP